MHILVNGENHAHLGDPSVSTLLDELGANPEHTALTVNGQLLVSTEWKTFTLTDGDAVEVLTFVGGG